MTQQDEIQTGQSKRSTGDPSREFAPLVLRTLPARPLFSVLVANYNYGQYIGLALESLLGQSYGNFEALVCDDGSTDNSREVIQSIAERDSRIRLISQRNCGVASALNSAYAYSSGDLIAILDADDVFQPSKLEKVLAAFRNSPRAGMCVHSLRPVNDRGLALGKAVPPVLERGWLGPTALARGGASSFPPASGLVFRREVAAVLFPIPTHVKRGADYYLCQTAQFVTEVEALDEELADYRLHGQNLTGFFKLDAEALERLVEDLDVLCPLQGDFLGRYYGPERAAALRLDDHLRYWDFMLAVYILRGKPRSGFRGIAPVTLIEQVPIPSRQRAWRLVVALPKPLARRALSFWWNDSKLNNALKLLLRPWRTGRAQRRPQ